MHRRRWNRLYQYEVKRPMLIYAAADIHGHPRRIRRLTSQVADHRPDILLLAGDISGRRQLEVTLDGLNRLGLPVLLMLWHKT